MTVWSKSPFPAKTKTVEQGTVNPESEVLGKKAVKPGKAAGVPDMKWDHHQVQMRIIDEAKNLLKKEVAISWPFNHDDSY